jgi:hypothetical protein
VGIGAGFTFLHGDLANCGGCPNSYIVEARALYSQELYRRGRLIVGMPIAVGMGAEWMQSQASTTKARSYGTLSGSFGISAAYAPRGAIGWEYEFGVLLDLRCRLFAGGTATADLDSIAIPDILIGGLIQATVRLAVARASAP